ncbi:glycerol-3-phosphate dehydrogenase subunit GlpB [Halapricum desulfuricans]|uniref:Anaerobic glycerol-3-phosphate dehydrogenase n=1 Tax=Halapricum desulfuricans TaxID=2841257 RepID=A0A897NML7_9EURY|nr:glycerol-3-phosphate dehydrogenase subunit GlpB [Halapricum desulfuricans]QSG13958.1 Anaerobic glycerol-3-phosphate dehydrogenase [Halapricum desulfuricans]
MAIEDDVLVIGGGIAGLTSAIAAAETGARTRLVTYKQSTLGNASGLVDVLGYAPGDDAPRADPYDALAELPAEHPYSKVGADAVREGLALFDDAVGDDYLGNHSEANALVATHAGSVKPTARYPRSAAPGLVSDDRDMLLVGIDSVTGFDAPMAADHLSAAGVPFDVRGETVRFPKSFPQDADVTRYARALDRDESVDDGTVREVLADRVEAVLEDERRVGFPAVLGDSRHEVVRTELQDRLGVDVFEVPTGPPSLPGLRLEDALYDAAEDAGVRITSGNPIVDYDADGGRVEQVLMDRMGSEVAYEAQQYVLATGGPVGGGIESDRGGVEESIFGLPVEHPDDRYEWFEDDVWGDHAYTEFGVSVDEDLRPVAGEDAQFENLRAAGNVIGGYDFATEKSGSGVSLATGYVAGSEAGELI